MTYEEARTTVAYLLAQFLEVGKNGTSDALSIALDCIEKQIPKPKHKYQGYRCVCGEEVAKHKDYCEYCGQKLLGWSEK